jgi:hypothetical protein
MNRLKCFLTILTVLFLAACSDEKERRLENQVAALSDQVAVLSNQVEVLRAGLVMDKLDWSNQVDVFQMNALFILSNQQAWAEHSMSSLWRTVDLLDSNQVIAARNLSNFAAWATGSINSLLLTARTESRRLVMLDAVSKGFQRIDSDTGSFLVSCEDVTPYLDGYKIRLRIGNLSSATYNGFKLTVKWGRAMPTTVDQADGGTNSLKEKEMSFTEDLRPGAWNSVEVVLSPAKPDQLKFLVLANMETPILSLLKPQPAS